MLPVIMLSALAFGDLLAGVVLVEAVFSWPGVEAGSAQSILSEVYAPVQAAIILAALVYLLLGPVLPDILYGVVDPRARIARRSWAPTSCPSSRDGSSWSAAPTACGSVTPGRATRR